MTPRLPVLLLFLILHQAATAVRAEEDDAPQKVLSANLDWEDGPRAAYRPRGIDLRTSPPAGTAPLEGIENAIYGTSAAGAEALRIATQASRAGYRLWVDTDFDGDLGDERPVHFRPRGSTWEAAVVLGPPAPPGATPHRLVALVYRSKRATSKRVYLIVPTHRAGTVVMEDRLRRVEVHDTDGDLRYGSKDDALYVDVDGDGRLDTNPDTVERIRPGTPFGVRASGYVASVIGATANAVTYERVGVAPPPTPTTWKPWHVPTPGRPRRASPKALEEAQALHRKFAAAGRNDRSLLYQLRRKLSQVGRVGTDAAFKFLYQVYRETDDDAFRDRTVAAMGNAAFVEHASKVAKIARSTRNPNLRRAAIRALHAMDAPGRDKVFAGLARRTTDVGVFAEAVKHLAYTQTELARKVLTELAVRRVQPERHRALYEAATRYAAHPPAREIVEAAIRSKAAAVRGLAFADARRIDPVLAHRLALEFAAGAGADPTLHRVVVDDLATWGDAPSVKAVLPLAEGLAQGARGRLIDQLRLVRSPEAVHILIRGLGASTPATRRLVADVLAGMPGEEVGSALAARMARERDDAVVVALARALERHPHPATVDAIIAAARKHVANVDVQEAALRALAGIGLAHPSVARFFADRVKAAAWADRVIALEAAGLYGSRHAAALLLASLDDPVWQVRLAAAQGLGRVRVKQAVLPLIARLEAEGDGRARIAVEEALFRTTGQHLYDVAERWRLWWADRGVAFEVPTDVPERPAVAPETRYATFYGLPVRSDKVAFVIDKSGSMSRGAPRGGRGSDPEAKNNLDIAVEETLKVARKLGARAKANVVLFESGVHRWRPGLVKMNATAQKGLKTYLEKQQPSGGTNLFDALELALKMKDVEEIYLLSDGVPSAGRFQRAEDIRREIHALNRRLRIVIHCVALGHRSELLKQLSADSGGTYVRR